MICTKCRDSGQRSIIHILGTKQTQVPRDVFFDEDGEEHNHNPNIVTTQYRCSNGHRFEERSSWQCHCGWMKLKAVIVFVGEGAAEA